MFTHRKRSYRCDDEKLVTYSTGEVCQHCVWLNDQYVCAPRWIPKVGDPFYIIKGTREKAGITVFESGKKFEYAFNCVYGEEGIPSHNTIDLSSLLQNVFEFVKYLRREYGIYYTRLLVNSNVNMKRYGGKEHSHALLTMNSNTDRKIYIEEINPETLYATDFVASKPYPQDKIVHLTDRQAQDLFRNLDIPATDIIKQATGIRDIRKESFYLFVTLDCKNVDDVRIEGKVSF